LRHGRPTRRAPSWQRAGLAKSKYGPQAEMNGNGEIGKWAGGGTHPRGRRFPCPPGPLFKSQGPTRANQSAKRRRTRPTMKSGKNHEPLLKKKKGRSLSPGRASSRQPLALKKRNNFFSFQNPGGCAVDQPQGPLSSNVGPFGPPTTKYKTAISIPQTACLSSHRYYLWVASPCHYQRPRLVVGEAASTGGPIRPLRADAQVSGVPAVWWCCEFRPTGGERCSA